MRMGNWELTTVSGGNLLLDGGTMFGVVPKPLWERLQPADAQNRIRCANNCVLARDGRQTVLIDAGYGGKATAKERERMSLDPGEPLLESLAAVGVAPEQIDLVVLSHLHFDHAGGCTRLDGSRLVPAFPRARYVAQRGEWEVALSGVPELRGSYPLEHLVPLAEAGMLDLVEGNVEIVPGLRTRVTGGHTRWHQVVLLESEGQTAAYLGDLCPMAAHMRTMWGMGYDVYPLDTRINKPQLLGEAADQGWLVLWDHDPDMAACRLARDPQREFRILDSWRRL
jgi:glyoxylase-like metal-dependent hydrolase (beta-lactamase superfamily II)